MHQMLKEGNFLEISRLFDLAGKRMRCMIVGCKILYQIAFLCILNESRGVI